LSAPVAVAILLAAGEGSRLRAVEPYKPLAYVGGKALIDHALDGLAAIGITRAVVVVGYGKAAVRAHLAGRSYRLAVETVSTDWHVPNGTSVLAGATRLHHAPALLAMCDHLVDPALYARVAAAGPGPGLTLGIDRRLDSDWIDLDDVTRVVTSGQRIVEVGKGIARYDAFDTGVFAVAEPFYAALAGIDQPSISAGVNALAATGRARAIDVGDLDWIDVDNAAALRRAEAWRAGLAAG
jgi:1L-myo-inositol 1-phosphate cytidylyltransferase